MQSPPSHYTVWIGPLYLLLVSPEFTNPKPFILTFVVPFTFINLGSAFNTYGSKYP